MTSWGSEMIEFVLTHTADIEKAAERRIGDAVTVVYKTKNGQRMVQRMRYPEKWLMVARHVRDLYKDDENFNAFFRSRYERQEDWRASGLAKNTYFARRAEVMRMAELYAVYLGVLTPIDCME